MKIDYSNRIAADDILKPGATEVFVFGSDLNGRHTKFAAKTALKFGAIMGQAAGLQGRSYGIPTKGKNMQTVLTVPQIGKYVDELIAFAKTRPDLTFLVTAIGCGSSKYKPKDIAPLFKDAVHVPNIHLPARFWHKLKSCMN